MQSLLPIASFAERAQLSRRTIERKIAKGEIAAHYVRRRGRRVFIDAAALATVAPDLSRHDATRQAVKL
jgi:excisionase family DNA binding protein